MKKKPATEGSQVQGAEVPKDENPKGAIIKRALVRTIAFVMVVVLSYYLIDYLSGSVDEEYDKLWLPILVFASMIYASSLLTVIWQGMLAKSVKVAVETMALFIFLALLINDPPSNLDFDLGSITVPLLLTGGLLAATRAAKPWHHHAWILLRAIFLVSCGWLLQGFLEVEGSMDLSEVVLPAFLITAVFSLLGLFDAHSNAMLRTIGKGLHSNGKVLLLLFSFNLLVWYWSVYRPGVPEDSLRQVSLMEWAFIGLLTGAVLFLVFRYLRKRGAVDSMGDWGRLVQVISHERGDMDRARATLDSFVNDGDKEKLIVMTVNAMKANGVGDVQTERAIVALIDYVQREDRLYFSWTMGDRMRREREERLMLAVETMRKAAESMNAGHLVQKAEKVELALSHKEGAT